MDEDDATGVGSSVTGLDAELDEAELDEVELHEVELDEVGLDGVDGVGLGLRDE